MKSFILIFFFALFSSISYSQVYNIENQITFGGNNTEFLYFAKKTNDGGFILCGSSTSGISGDKTENTKGGSDYWLIKLNSSFVPQWQKDFGGSSCEVLQDILTLNDSSYILIGGSCSPISGDKTEPNIGNTGNDDFWIIKMDNNQNIIWQKAYGGNNGDRPIKGYLLNDGKILIAGESDSDTSGTKTENSNGGTDYWLIKIDSAGNQIWDKDFGGSGYERFSDMAVFNNGDILLSGYSNSPASGDKTEGHFGSVYDNDIWVIKLDSNGNKLWDKTIGGDSSESGGYIAILNNKIYLASSSFSGISGLKTENSKGGLDYWITKLDSSGNLIWDKTIGGNNNDCIGDIAVVNGNKLLISGSSSSGISGDKNEVCRINNDYWIYCIDTNSIYKWQKTIGGSGLDQVATSIEINSNHYIIAGTSDSGYSGDKTDVCRGNYDYWAVELSVITNSENHEYSSSFKLMPNPVLNFLQIKSDQENCFNVKIYNSIGVVVYENNKYFTGNLIDIQQLKSGIYFVEILSEAKGISNIKFLKE